MRALVVLSLVVPVCVAVIYAIRAQSRGRRYELETQLRPERDLATAVRLLDRAATCDDVMPYLTSELRTEIREFLARYQGREIEA